MQLYYHPLYSQLTLPERHRFPITKYQQLQQALKGLGYEHFIQPNQVTAQQLKRCHSADYIADFLNGSLTDKAIKKMGFPHSCELVERTLYSVGASVQAAENALKTGLAANLSGGYHHAYSHYGSGFCIFNDLAIAAAHLIATEQADTVLIFDCDVHQGDGTAQVTQQHKQIITCSIHCEQNFPRKKQQSTYDFALPANTSDGSYLKTVEQALELSVRLHQPDIILYNAGADIFTKDELGLFDVSLEGVYARDFAILNFCKQRKIPLMCALGGGYQRSINNLVNVHTQLFKAALDL